MRIVPIEPHGFCAGVKRALALALEALDARRETGEPLYGLHELVHNELVVADLELRGMRFVDVVDAVPEGGAVLFSAHGVAPAVRARAAERRLRVVDATCPFVARVHEQVRAFVARGLPVVIVGNPAHAEAVGLAGETARAHFLGGELPPKGARVGVVSQTTMNADDVAAAVARLRADYEVETSAETCQATRERQEAVRRFVGDGVLVLGSPNSSNTRRLAEIAAAGGRRTWRAGTLDEVRAADFSGVETLGVTSGASTPESFFDAVRRELCRRLGVEVVEWAACGDGRRRSGAVRTGGGSCA